MPTTACYVYSLSLCPSFSNTTKCLLLSVHLLGLNWLQLRLLGLYSFIPSTKTESSRAFLLSVHLLGLNWLQLHLLGLYSFIPSTKTDPVLPLAALCPAIRPRGLSAISSVIQALHLTRRQRSGRLQDSDIS